MVLKDISDNTVTNSNSDHSLNVHSIRYFSVYFLFPSLNQPCSFYYFYFTDRDDKARKLWSWDCIQVPLVPKAISETFIIRDSAHLRSIIQFLQYLISINQMEMISTAILISQWQAYVRNYTSHRIYPAKMYIIYK